MDQEGARLVQKAIDVCSSAQRLRFLGILSHEKSVMKRLIFDKSGHHVIRRFLGRVPCAEIEKHVMTALLGNCHEMAKHKYACRVIQDLIEFTVPSLGSWVADNGLATTFDLMFGPNSEGNLQGKKLGF